MNDIQVEENLKKYTRIANCPIRNVIARFSGKWSLLVLCVLAESPVIRFGALGRAIPDISHKVLSDTLHSLEDEGLVRRRQYAEVPPRVEYTLTAKGESLMPIVNDLVAWAVSNYPELADGAQAD